MAPSVSKKQEKFMRAAAHNKIFAAHAHISQAVAREFYAADKAKKRKRMISLSPAARNRSP